jgi:hypothetical protein
MVRYGSTGSASCPNCGTVGLTHIGFTPLYRDLGPASADADRTPGAESRGPG